MHMADGLISTETAAVMGTVTVGALGYAVHSIRKDGSLDRKIPLMASAGAFVFAGQMINFAIPMTGSSGHIGGGLLLAAILGGGPSLLTMFAILLIQCLIFADGGLLALGCNVFNMGVIPAFIGLGIYKMITKMAKGSKGIFAASIISVIISLQLGAFSVVMETEFSGVTAMDFGTFVLLMQPIHLAIGLVEGIVTGFVLSFIYKIKPEILENHFDAEQREMKKSLRTISVILMVIAITTGGIISHYASSDPDGLEWSIGHMISEEELGRNETSVKGEKIVEKTALMPDYDYADSDKKGSTVVNGTTLAGICGTAVTMVVLLGIGTLIRGRKKKYANR